MPMTRNDARSSVQIRKLTYSALYLAIALVLPFLTGQIPEIGSMLCPMHIPALLCGFVCGWPWGLAVGFVSPLLRSLLFGMPTAPPGSTPWTAASRTIRWDSASTPRVPSSPTPSMRTTSSSTTAPPFCWRAYPPKAPCPSPAACSRTTIPTLTTAADGK